MRFVAGSRGIVSVLLTNTENVGVSPASMLIITGLDDGVVGLVHAPELGSVSHILTVAGRLPSLVTALIIRSPPTPTFTDATANAPAPAVSLTIPSLLAVATNATTSGVGVDDAESRREFTPTIVDAAVEFAQLNPNDTVRGENSALGVIPMMNEADAPAARSTGVFGEPTATFVAGSVR